MKMKLNKKSIKVLRTSVIRTEQTKQIGGGKYEVQATYMECYSRGPVKCTSMPCV
ncbi:hypothetical protein L1077_11035 [Pseudoalteromonas luteoviolacea]|uniref:hypothetical protein n=1 Tax=Pseudoalteromonas luteoviolacea TaxID=43657 RepID=UPI001F3AD36E|nr:hypothetical protein [Pseudoalteromonas luteoviolacea]MCF6439967.1 hypothetical protein [Pseudoalteromonas luteoviolacea]